MTPIEGGVAECFEPVTYWRAHAPGASDLVNAIGESRR